MMDEKKRRNWGFAGSAIIHILIFLIVSFTGLFQFSHAQENIVEVTFFGGGGGGGSDDAGVIEEAEPEATAAEETSDNDAIFEANKEINLKRDNNFKEPLSKNAKLLYDSMVIVDKVTDNVRKKVNIELIK